MKTLTILLITVAFVATSVSAADIGGPICYACETLVNKLEDYISGGHTADEVKAWIDSVRSFTLTLIIFIYYYYKKNNKKEFFESTVL